MAHSLEVPGNRLPETGSRRKLLNVRGAWQEVWMQELEGKLKRLRQNRANIGNLLRTDRPWQNQKAAGSG
ncbi:hypothetical protein V6N13_081107 [Hibiscus sabdariffa]|uniref:Uncharacterized protein n=1 Tax=Hibiscus sabdariffa TaxID=183260 RepID=A0ABR2DBG7_9ROSI